jgi:hypothetical protein
MVLPKRSSSEYKIIVWILTGLIFIVLGVIILQVDNRLFSFGDFPNYWAAGRLQATHQNPYDPNQIIRLKADVGQSLDELKLLTCIIYPPWTLPILQPFGLIPFKLSRMLWLITHIGILIYATQKIWEIYNGPNQYKWLSFLVLIAFFPTTFLLAVGHMDSLFLLGVILFISLVSDEKPKSFSRFDFIAGFSLVFTVIKIHVLYLFLLTVLIWVLRYKRWNVLLGIITSLSTFIIIALASNPYVFQQYLQLMRVYPLNVWVTPTIGAVLRNLLGPDKFWLQFVPPIIGIIWLLLFWKKNGKSWVWIKYAPLIVLISVVTMAYGWTLDYIVLLLPLLQGSILLLRTGNWRIAWVMFVALLGANMLVFFLHSRLFNLHDGWYFWFAPFLLGWYLITKQKSEQGFQPLSILENGILVNKQY